ncbi:MAG TPA: ATP-binding cassette domain-containing protein [Alphaproteobacteria bacterium]|jgi:tungstate transport system ATP-binding protein
MRAEPSNLPIVFDDVSLRVGAITLLDRIGLGIPAGSPTVLVGPNGAGKTSLIRLGMALAAPSSGHINWGGREQPHMARCAMVFQRPVMLRRSAAQNVAFALVAAGRARSGGRIAALLDQVGLAPLADRPARRLSGGEQQRLALARALARDPEVLFLDEPTASLDPAATKAVEDIVVSVAVAGIKIVLTTHDLGQARRIGGDIVFLVRGRVVEHAPAERFFTAPATHEAATFIQGGLVL